MRTRVLCRPWAIWLLAGVAVVAQQAPIPAATELPGQPFAIKKTWVIGGNGNWDYLTLDPDARQLFIAHQSRVQVVDVDSGNVAGEVTGFSEAHSVVLDPNGQVGYVSDGRANLIRIFDRRTFQGVGKIQLPASPRALVFDPTTGLLFAFGALPTPPPPPRNTPPDRHNVDPCSSYGNSWPPPPAYQSLITIVDPGKQTQIADVQVCGILGAAASDGAGQVYFAITNFNELGRLNASSILELARQHDPAALRRASGSLTADGTLLLDFKMATLQGSGPHFHIYRLGSNCQEPRAVAVDGSHARLFAGCANQKLEVLATDHGGSLADLTIGPGVDDVVYDPGRGLIFTANGGGYGSITVVRQHLTDDYSVVQNLPTMERARTMALDPASGLVYLVTAINGANITNPYRAGTPGKVTYGPLDGSFQVLVIGN